MKRGMRYTAWLLAMIALAATMGARAAQTCQRAIKSTVPDTDLSSGAHDGTVTHIPTGLIWRKCSEGQTYDAASDSCSGTPATYTWQQALQRARAVNQGSTGQSLNQTDWRVPNVKELRSLVEQACASPAINADRQGFPLTPAAMFWSSSPFAHSVGEAWGVDFDLGTVLVQPMTAPGYLRLVRGGL